VSRPDPPAADRPAVVWLTPDLEPLARRVADEAGLTVVAAGCVRVGRASPPTSILSVETSPDLRRAMAEHPDAGVVALALGAEDRAALAEPDERAGARSTPPIFVCDPVYESMAAAARAAESRPGWTQRLRPAPAFAHTPGGSSALAALETYGRVRSMDFAARSARGAPALPMLLLDAMEYVAAALGEPELVDASISGLDAPSSLRLTPGETVLAVAGDLTAHLRFSDDRAAAVSLSDRAGSWFRGATLLGPGGCIRCDDSALEWLSPEGEVVERSDAHAGESGIGDLLAGQIAAQWSSAPETPAVRRLTAWAIAEAALLSARTGQPEAPATIRRMAGVA